MGRGAVSPPDRGGGGGRGLQPGRDAAVGRGTAMPGAPAHPVTPGLAALGCRDARGGHAGGGRDPPREGRSKRGPGGHAACWGHGRDTSLRGGGGRHRGAGVPALCWVGGEGGGERTPHGHPGPSPAPRGFVPSPLQPRGALPLPAVPTALLSLPVSLVRGRDCGGCCFPPAGGWGKGWSPDGQGGVRGPSLAQGPGGSMGSRDPHWLSLS